MHKLFRVLINKWYLLLIAFCAIIAQVWFQLTLPEFTGNIQSILNGFVGGSSTIINPISQIATVIQGPIETGEVISLILDQGAWMLLACAIVLVLAYVQFYCSSKIGAYLGQSLRERLFKKVNTMTLSQYNQFGTATLITRTTNDIERIKSYVSMAIRIMVMAPTFMVIGLIKTLTFEDPGPKLTIVLLIAIPLFLVVLVLIFIVASPLFKKLQESTDNITIVVRENLTGVRVVRAYNQQAVEEQKFDDVNNVATNLIKKVGKTMSIANPSINIIFHLCFIGIYGFGFYLLTQIVFPSSDPSAILGTIGNQIRVISVVAQYSMTIMNSFLMFAMIIIMVPQAATSAKRVNEVLSLPDFSVENDIEKTENNLLTIKKFLLHKVKDDYKAKHNNEVLSISLLTEKYATLTDEEKKKDKQYNDFIYYKKIENELNQAIIDVKKGDFDSYTALLTDNFKKIKERGVLEFRNVTFQYPDANTPTISNISFKTAPGKTTAIIGSTGSGKSSVINLIPRFYDVTSGEILLDNININLLPQKVLRQQIGFVPQQAVLFSGTIRENISYGKTDATDEEILESLKVAQAEHFISKLPDGIDTFVSQGGKNFSGGQKQRLSIARCLVRKPELYVFDDSFSALDFKTDAQLRRALKTYTKDATVIVVAQRVSSIMDADNILVMNEGLCVAQGKHNELLKTCSVYQDIVKSQLDPDEVAKTIKMNKEILKEGGTK
ncbi:MAG TPA: ABC transporter ATP-binding protein [Candidatus Onthovivens sp.]|nr:ABC transporter ATP-binding protein [Candidatus Onthovivens sp.]